MNFNRNFFTNVPIEYAIPKRANVVAVSDYFVGDMSGGAELTLEAILKASTKSVFRVHSSSLTQEMAEQNKDKHWVFGNYTMVSHDVLDYFARNKLKYSIIEFDFKYCKFRAPNYHFLNTGKICDCITTSYGKVIENFCLGSEKMFWMSAGQRDIFLKNVPSLKEKEHVVQLSCFTPETFDLINSLKKPTESRKPITAVLGEGSWIKGVAQTVSWLKHKRVPFEQIPNLEYPKFLEELSKYKSLTFKPMDFDTCPRVVIEAKLLGCELVLNDNVLMKDDEWFNKSAEEIESYLKSKPKQFWVDFNEV